ncbi:DUF5721 family protein [Clostridium sp. HBUAS56010]|uniref:DUF5721 family protein n=1 Tax=Clostridium sp. HBUAS56010 TaxID=2571127 RepID=UPI0011780C9C|nr:DUF5721 family protein [Clostridium sp. HBUAS56010]
MIAVKIEDIKSFASKLYVGEVFDSFLVKEAVISTYNTFTIDGAIKNGYYSQEETEERNLKAYSYWSAIKPFCFSLIKGKRLPGSFRIILLMAKEGISQFLSSRNVGLMEEQVTGLYINIRYEEEVLTCVTGTSVSVFTLDKALDEEWDQAFRGFLKQNEIPFVEE